MCLALAAAIGACALWAMARRVESRRRPGFVSHEVTESPEEIDAFWTDERLDSAVPEEMPTVDRAYWAQLLALQRLLWWLPAHRRSGAAQSLLEYVGRVKRLLPTAK